MHASCLGCPEDATQILGVHDAIQDNQESRFASTEGQGHDLFRFDIGKGSRFRQYPLMGRSLDPPI